MIRALLFDFDGLILDTETAEYEVWREVYAQHGCELELTLWCDCVGRPHGYFDPYADLERRLGRPIDQAAVRTYRRWRFNELVEQSTVLPGVEALLHDARDAGMHIALVSSSTHAWCEQHLSRLGLLSYFDVLVCREDTLQHKPLPAPYEEALRRLGVMATEAVALEDSMHGITAARAAGIFTIAVPNPVTRTSNLAHADASCVNLGDMPLPAVLAAAGARLPLEPAAVEGRSAASR